MSEELEQKLEAFELKVREAVRNQIDIEFNDYDNKLHEHSKDVHARVDEVVVALGEARNIVSDAKSDAKELVERLVAEAVSRVSREVVVKALKDALKNTIVVTRPASRDEAKSGVAIPTRQASVHEINGAV
jgi:vacuolar-type H+-ATPase subunit H